MDPWVYHFVKPHQDLDDKRRPYAYERNGLLNDPIFDQRAKEAYDPNGGA